MSMSPLDSGQVIKSVFDAVNGALQVSVVASTGGGSPTPILDGGGSGNKATVTATLALKVDGSAVTQPVSATALPLPTGAATAAKQPALGTAGVAATDVISVQGIASMTALKVDGSAVTQPVSATSLPLPSGASTAAKQPALGTAGTASADVLTVQGIASMTALKVDGSATTQPVSATSLPLPTGAATAAKQPALGTAGTASSDVISVQGIASMTALKVDGSAVTQPVSAASLPLPSGASTAAKQPALGTAGTASSDVLTVQGIASMTALKVDGSAVTQPVSELCNGSVTAGTAGTKSQLMGGQFNTSLPTLTTTQQAAVQMDSSGRIITSPLTNSSIVKAQLQDNAGTAITVGQAAMASSLPVVIASNQSAVPASQSGTWASRTQDGSGNALTSATQGTNRGLHEYTLGYSAINHARNDYTSTNVTTAAYTQIIASTAADAQEIEVFDSNGNTMLLALGAAGSEVDKIYIIPGGQGRIKLYIAASTRISIKAVVATASTGEFVINLYG